MEIISAKITSVFETGAVKAKANAVLGRFGVRGIKVCEGKSGLFVAMPSYKSAKGKYIDIFFPMDKEAKEELAGAVLRAYAEKQAANAAAAVLAGQEPGPEPYGARAGQRLPAQRLKPQGAEKEKMPVKKKLTAVCVLMAAVCLFAATAFAETGDVAGVIQSTWQSAAQQIKTVVNTVVFPALDLILVTAFFVKAGTTYYEYRKHGQIEWTGLILLFAGLVLTLTAPLYIWTIAGV